MKDYLEPLVSAFLIALVLYLFLSVVGIPSLYLTIVKWVAIVLGFFLVVAVLEK